MEQTKESFEKYLEECRQENAYGDRPSKEEISCPMCPGLMAPLRCSPAVYWVIPYKWEGVDWHYVCDKCKESFITTESDTISLASFKLVP